MGRRNVNRPNLASRLRRVETEWVLRSRYRLKKAEIVVALSALMDTAEITFEDEPSVEHAVYTWKDSATGFAGCLINARNLQLGCRATATVDGKAAQLAGVIAA